MSFSNVFSGRRVLITGHTGFKGAWLSAWLLHKGAEVAGFSLDVPTEPSGFNALGLQDRIHDYRGDIRDRAALATAMDEFKPEIIFHLAAQSLVRRSYADPTYTFETNTIGTMNVLECLRERPSVKVAVLITSDKCYRNDEWVWGYRENDVLGGDDPYSASKACAELVAHAYHRSFLQSGGTRIATTRAGNVIGGGDWAADRIVPDAVRAWYRNETLSIRSPHATRPWQHVLEPLSGYLWLAARLLDGDEGLVGEAFNFGPKASVNQSVQELIEVLAEYWSDAPWSVDQGAGGDRKEATLLKLSCDKALAALAWETTLDFSGTVRFTGQWYQTFYAGENPDMFTFTINQIEEFSELARRNGQTWAC